MWSTQYLEMVCKLVQSLGKIFRALEMSYKERAKYSIEIANNLITKSLVKCPEMPFLLPNTVTFD